MSEWKESWIFIVKRENKFKSIYELYDTIINNRSLLFFSQVAWRAEGRAEYLQAWESVHAGQQALGVGEGKWERQVSNEQMNLEYSIA